MATGTTYDFNLSRDEIIEQALRKVGGLAAEETPTASQLLDGIKSLNGIVRAMDLRDKQLWKIATYPSYLSLIADTAAYTYSLGMPSNILDLVSVRYVDAANGSVPLKILTIEDYDALEDPLVPGTPDAVFMETRRNLSDVPTMFVRPVPTTITAESVVTGTDSERYKCIYAHTSAAINRPITGANYLQYWQAGGSAADETTWAADTAYTASERLMLRYRAPLADFDLATDNADFPAGFGLWLTFELAHVFSFDYGVPLEERAYLRSEAKDQYNKVFPYLIPDTNNHHNRHLYF